VAFSAGIFSGSSRGVAPGPVDGVRQALRERGIEVRVVNEDNMNQLCNKCFKKVRACTEDGRDGGVRRCLTATCFRNTTNRDADAALNMLHVFTEEALRGARPVDSTVQLQQQQQPGLNAHVLPMRATEMGNGG
jgi:hypothetical protein